VVGKVEDVGYERLPFNLRWQKDFFVEGKTCQNSRVLLELKEDPPEEKDGEEVKTEEVFLSFISLSPFLGE